MVDDGDALKCAQSRLLGLNEDVMVLRCNHARGLYHVEKPWGSGQNHGEGKRGYIQVWAGIATTLRIRKWEPNREIYERGGEGTPAGYVDGYKLHVQIHVQEKHVKSPQSLLPQDCESTIGW